MRGLRHFHMHFLKNDDGPTTVEYAVLLFLICAICIGAIAFVGQGTSRDFTKAGAVLGQTANPPPPPPPMAP